MSNALNKLAGKVALVSGSGRGIGREIALKLAREGAAVVINDLDEAPARQTVAEIEAAGGRALACVGSVTEAGFAERFVEAAVSTYGGLDIIVNNAGYTWDSVVQKMSDEQWEAMLAVHLTAPFRILRAASGFIREANRRESEEGRDVFRKVVNISSTSGVYGNAGQANYAAAKAGILGFTRSIAAEVAKKGVTVNAIAPGYIGTDMVMAIKQEVRDSIVATIPVGRLGKPEEIGALCAYLVSDLAGYMTGATLNINGGLHYC